MQNRSFFKVYSPLFLLFLGLGLFLFILHQVIPGNRVDFRVLQAGNLLLFIIGWISMRMSLKALLHKNVQLFLRLVYGSFMMKFFVLALVAFIYIFTFRKEVNKPAILGCFGLYFVYTFIEIRAVLKQSKTKNA